MSDWMPTMSALASDVGTEAIDAFIQGQPFGAGKESGEQQSIEWLTERIGHCTGSRFDDVMKKVKSGKPSTSRQTYLLEVVTERILNRPGDYYFSNAMLWGLENETAAKMAYEAHTGAMLTTPGFRRHSTIQWCGVSSDGLVDDTGTIEVKCPANPRNTVMTWLGGMPSEHMAQVQGGLWVWNRQWADFISYDPRMPPDLQLYVQRIERDEDYIAMLTIEVTTFLAEADELLSRIARRTAGAGA